MCPNLYHGAWVKTCKNCNELIHVLALKCPKCGAQCDTSHKVIK